MQRPTRIIITGEGGQGVQAMASILTKAAFNSGRLAEFLPNYGVEQRGGVSVAFIQICSCKKDEKSCDCAIGFPKFNKADVLINLRERAIQRTERYVSPKTTYIYDSSIIRKEAIDHIKAFKVGIPAESYAIKKLSSKVFNIVVLGAFLEETQLLGMKEVAETIEEHFKEKYKKLPQLKHLNRKALEAGAEMVRTAKGKQG